MATFDVSAPDGQKYSVNAPDGASEADAIAYVQKNFYSGKPEAAPTGTGILSAAVENTPKSAMNFLVGIGHAIAHPLDTAGTLFDAAAGGLHNALPNSISSAIDSIDPNPQAGQRAVATADAIGQNYKQRYGGLSNIGNTLATDPVGMASDLSMLLTGGAGMAAKVPALADAANAMGTAAKFTNPMSAVIPVVSATAKAAGTVGGVAGKGLIGLMTGTGAENAANAASAGFNGKTAFWDNLSGNVPASQILDQAQAALQNMRNTRSANYKSGIGVTAADNTPLDFAPIDTALGNVVDSMKSGDHWKIGPAEVNKIDEVQQIVDEWRQDPSMHTAIGLDALKQRLDAVYPDSPIHNQAQRAITTVRNAVKDTIVDQSPEYASTMADYESAIGLETEIKRALSLGDKASADTAMRKLQSLTRNNVNTNYGNRLDLAKQLEQKGGVDILPAISGQAMNSWMPRGLGGQAESLATLMGAAMHSPYLLAALPFQSPRAMGAMLYGGGKAARGLLNAVPAGVDPDALARYGLLASQAGNFQK